MTTEFSTEVMAYAPRNTGAPPQRGIDVGRLIRLRLPLMTGVFLVLAIPALVAVWALIPKEYTASEKIRFESAARTILGDGNTTSTTEYERYVNSFVALARDPYVLNTVWRSEEVMDLPCVKKSKDPMAMLQERISARAIPRTDLIEVSGTFGTSEEARIIVKAVAATVSKRADDQRQNSRTEAERVLGKKKDDLLAEQQRLLNQISVKKSERFGDAGVSYIEATNPIETTAIQSALSLAQQSVAVADANVAAARNERDRVAALEERRKEKPGEAIFELDIETKVQGDPQVQRLRSQEMALEQELSSSRYLPGRPELKAKEDQLKEVRQRIAEAETKARRSALRAALDNAAMALTAAESQQKAAQAMLAEAESKVDTQKDVQAALVAKQQDIAELERQVLENKEQLNRVEQQLFSREVEGSAPPLVDHLTKELVTPVHVDYGKRLRYGALVLVLAGGIGLLIGLVREMTDQQLRTSDDLTNITPLPVLAAIPQVMRGENGVASDSGGAFSEFGASTSTEEFRRILTRIIYPPEGAVEVKTILVTSPSQRDGKTSLACNLGIALSDANRRVLLVDICTRRPGVEKAFDLEPDHGLGEILAGEYSPEELVRPTDVPNLYVLGPGFQSRDVSRKLASREAVEFFEQAEQAFDHVIIDTPPCLLVSDAKLLSPVMDGIILVAGVGVSTVTTVRRCLLEMQQIGANVLGVVLNGVRVPRGKKQTATRNGADSENGHSERNGKVNGASHGKSSNVNIMDDEELPMILLVDDRGQASKGSDEA